VHRSSKLSVRAETAPPAAVPVGAPAWVTADLVELTLATWQRFYDAPLTPEDALAIIMTVGRLFEVLSRGTES
jgi:hypothetical protein